MKTDELAMRQQRLLVRSANLREALVIEVQPLKTPLALTDQIFSGLAWLRRHPGWPVGGLLLTAIVRPRKAMVWVGRLWWVWGSIKNVRRWVTGHFPTKAVF